MTPPRWPADLINDLCAWIADELGEPHPAPRRAVCRPVQTSRRRRA
ncbi:hypothetical protein [Micromonospora sp. NPDC005299]